MMASLALRQSPGLPKCGLDCITSAVFNSTCGPTDMPCICANPTLQGQAQQCVLASCTIRQQLTTVNIINGQCGIVSGHDRSWVPPMMFFVIFAGIIFVLRLVSRIYCHTKFWWDDFFNLLGALGCVAYATVCFVAGNLGLGVEMWAVPQENISTLLALSYGGLLLHSWCEITLRTSVLLFYTRIFANGTSARRMFWGVLIVSDIVSVAFFIFITFQCTPISYFWLRWDGEHTGHCYIPADDALLGGIVIDLFWTLVILVIPIPHVMRLQLPRYKKLAAAVMFAWGIFTAVMLCYRFTTLARYGAGDNPTIEGIRVTLWASIQLDVALICACMPSVYPLFLRFIRRHRKQPPPRPVQNSALNTIGGSRGNKSRSQRRGLWSMPSMAGLTQTSSHEDLDDARTKRSSREWMELAESSGQAGRL